MSTDLPSVLSQAVCDWLDDPVWKDHNGIRDVFYGDQALIPRTPALAVEPAVMNSEVEGAASFYLKNTLNVIIMLYLEKVQSPQLTRKQSMEHAEAVRARLHANKTMNGLVVYGFVITLEPGFAQRGEMMRATRITWQGVSKTHA